MVNQGSSGMVQEGYPGLEPQAEPVLIQISHQTIQEGDNNQEAHQDHNPPPVCCLHICKAPQEATEDQSKTLKWINQEALIDHT